LVEKKNQDRHAQDDQSIAVQVLVRERSHADEYEDDQLLHVEWELGRLEALLHGRDFFRGLWRVLLTSCVNRAGHFLYMIYKEKNVFFLADLWNHRDGVHRLLQTTRGPVVL
jgi:hypothetical protein